MPELLGSGEPGNESPPRLILVDLDGTLVGTNHEVSPRNAAALERATEAGARVVVATGRPVRSEVGMTGEVTLNGRVLPIGGLKQKLLAAQRNGLTEVFVPLRNEPDLDDVPAETLEALTVHIDWITRIVNGAVSVPDGLRSDREAVEKLVMA